MRKMSICLKSHSFSWEELELESRCVWMNTWTYSPTDGILRSSRLQPLDQEHRLPSREAASYFHLKHLQVELTFYHSSDFIPSPAAGHSSLCPVMICLFVWFKISFVCQASLDLKPTLKSHLLFWQWPYEVDILNLHLIDKTLKTQECRANHLRLIT